MSLVLTLSDTPIFPAKAAAAAPIAKRCPESRPDRYSAALAARWCGNRVEVSGDTSETTRIWAEKDGTFTADQAAGIQRFKQAGKWVEVDLTLQKAADGSVAPKQHPAGLKLAGASSTGNRNLVELGSGEQQMTLGWRGSLPDPVLEGTKATYRDVVPGVDLVVEVTRTGYEQSLVVKRRSALAAVPVLMQGLALSGPGAEADGEGGLFFKNQAGEVIGRTATPLMWDAATDAQNPDGHPNRKQLGLAVNGQKRAGAKTDVAVSADQVWLADPARQFPITIDPGTNTQTTAFDTYVASGTTSDLSGSTKLAIGTNNSGSTKRLAYVNFTGQPFPAGSRFNWATLKLWSTVAPACANGAFAVFGTITNAGTGTRWTNRPNLMDRYGNNVGQDGVGDAAFGQSSAPQTGGCTGQNLEADATGLFQYAVDHGWWAFTAALSPYMDDTNSFYKEFKSSETGTLPHVTVNWNEPPVVSNPITTPATSSCTTGSGRPYMTSKKPKLTATVNDSDGAPSDMNFEWFNVGGSQIGGTTINNVPSSTAATAEVPDGAFAEGGNYAWHVQAVDPAGVPASQWSAWCEFTVDTIKPGVPIVTSKDGIYPATGADNSWGHGGYGTSGTFTLTPGTPSSDLASFVYQLDTQATSTTVAATAAIDISVLPTEDGVRTLTVWSKDKAGNQSDPMRYVFNVGRAGLTEPRPNADIIKRTNVALVGDANYTRVRYQFRRGPGAPEQDIPWANMTNASGAAVSGTAGQPVALSSIGAKAGWNALDTLGPIGGVAQVRARLYTATGTVADGMMRNPISGRCLNIQGAGPYNNNNPIILFDCLGTDNEIFELGPDGLIRNPVSGRCLNIQGGAPYSNGQAIILFDCLTTAGNEKWVQQADGTIKNPDSGRCLNIQGAGPYNNGNPIMLFDCVGTDNEKFASLDTGYSTQWITVNVDPNGYGAATTAVGPGSVNLLTGNFSTSTGDVSQFGMSVGRAYSSRNPLGGLTPLGERLTANQQQVSTDTTGFGPANVTAVRATTRGQGGTTDSLQLAPPASGGSPVGDSFADVGGDLGAMRLNMQAGKRYRATGWIYVPAGTGLAPAYTTRGERIVVFAKTAGGYVEFPTAQASFVDGWQQLTVDFTVPAGATEAFIRLYNGFADGQTSKVVYWDNMSLKELAAPFGPQWSGGIADGTGSTYTTLEFPSNDLAKVNTVSGDPTTFGKSSTGLFFPEPDAATLTLVSVDATHYQLSDLDGSVTEFTKQPNSGVFAVSRTWTRQGDTTTYVYDVTGTRTRITRVVSPVESGIGDCAPGAPAKGCRTLDYDYAPATTATASVFGDVIDQVRSVSLWGWNPATSAMESTEMVHYAYDDQGRLREVWDPRITPSLKTAYTYNADGILSTITSPGLLPWQLNYTTLPSDSGKGRLANVSRSALPSGTATTSVVYGVPVSGSGAPYDMSATQLATWETQVQIPTDATAIFPPTQVPNGNQATGQMPSSWDRAALTYMDASARTVNTATPGGYIDTTWYDQWGNAVRELAAANRQRALSTWATYGTSNSAQAADWLSTVTQYTVDGRRRIKEWSPDHQIQLPDGTMRMVQVLNSFTYDEGAPATGQIYDLVTTESVDAHWWDGTGEHTADARLRKTEFDWTNMRPTKSIVDPAGLNLASRTTYDVLGRVVAQTSPAGGNSDTTPSTRVTVYYTAAANSTYTQCGNRAEWAGLVCLTKPGGQAGSGPDLPTTTTTYDRYGNMATMVESTSAGTLRTTTLTYDQAGRVSVSTLSAPGLGQQLEARRNVFDAATGALVKMQTLDGSNNVTSEIVRGYDSLGRLASYQDADGNTTTTTYDLMDRPLVVNDGKATRTYAYDEGTERRGLATSVVDSNVGRFAGVYDADETLVTQTWPNGVTVSTSVNEVGQTTNLTYTQPGCGQPDCTLYTEAAVYNAHGQTVRRNTSMSNQTYGYDSIGRLTSVGDIVGGQCTSRVYTYDAATNRKGVTTYPAAPITGDCQTTSGGSAIAWTFDTADRANSTGYSYDALGRTLTMPGQDTAIAGGGNETITYHANDMARSLQQGTRTAVYNLDVISSRFRSWTDNATGTTITKTNHFGDDGDSPIWTDEGAGANYTRVIGSLGGVAAVHAASTGELYVIANLHGDFIAGMAETGYGLTYTSEQNENGQPRNPADAGTRRYGWLGSAQRSADTPGGLVLMGSRLYSPGSGRFLSTDPVEGGSANSYEYCAGDSVGCADTSGQAMDCSGSYYSSRTQNSYTHRSWAGVTTLQTVTKAVFQLRCKMNFITSYRFLKSLDDKKSIAFSILFGAVSTLMCLWAGQKWGALMCGLIGVAVGIWIASLIPSYVDWMITSCTRNLGIRMSASFTAVRSDELRIIPRLYGGPLYWGSGYTLRTGTIPILSCR